MKKTMRRGGSPPPQATDPWKNAKSAAYTPGGRPDRTTAAQARVDEVRKGDERLRAENYHSYVAGPSKEGEAAELLLRQQAHEQNQALQAEQRAAQAAVRAAQAERRAQAQADLQAAQTAQAQRQDALEAHRVWLVAQEAERQAQLAAEPEPEPETEGEM